jgi:predicted Zn-dependent peptidase
MCKNERFGRYVYGNIDDVDRITNDDLFNHYLTMIHASPIDVFVVGNVDPQQIISLVKQVFDIQRNKIKSIPKEIVKRAVGQEKYHFEKLDVTQGKLSLGYRTNTEYQPQSYIPLVVFNSILGGGTHSKLFINVREKNSLAYYIFARLEKFKGLMIISSGIEIDNYQRALDIIKEQVSEIKEGKVTDQELAFSIKALETELMSATDSPAQLMDYYLGNQIKGVDMSISSFIERVKQVDKEQVIRAANLVKLDTVYFLTNNQERRVSFDKDN